MTPRWQWVTWKVRCSDGRVVYVREAILWYVSDAFCSGAPPELEGKGASKEQP